MIKAAKETKDLVAVHLGKSRSSDHDRVDPFFVPPKGRLGITHRENYDTANSLGFRIGQDDVEIRRLMRRTALTQGPLPYRVKDRSRP